MKSSKDEEALKVQRPKDEEQYKKHLDKLKETGWVVGDYADFLGLTLEEKAKIEEIVSRSKDGTC